MKAIIKVEGEKHIVGIYVEARTEKRAREKAVEIVRARRLLANVVGTSLMPIADGTLVHIEVKR